MNTLFQYSNRLILEVDTKFIRYKYSHINFDNRLIGLIGPRGIGKTTLVLQYLKNYLPSKKSLYVTTEDFYFTTNRIIDLADEFVRNGGNLLAIDEIHKYPNWSQELKLIYDYHKNLKVIFTGSSVLDIKSGVSDLSRRAIIYNMQGLSFREYLFLFHEIDVPAFNLESVLNHQVFIPQLKTPILYFKDYLVNGYYPFSLENEYEIRLHQVVNQTLEVDIPIYAQMNTSTGRKLKQLLGIIGQSVPFKPNMSKIADLLQVSRNNIADYLQYIEDAGLINQLRAPTSGIRSLGKVEKIYLENTNLIKLLSQENQNIGNLREIFFLNQVKVNYEVTSSETVDFRIGEYEFEVGGKSKGLKQISKLKNGFVVKDDIETGYLNQIPLWHFGLMY